jgi:hypothetical protein
MGSGMEEEKGFELIKKTFMSSDEIADINSIVVGNRIDLIESNGYSNIPFCVISMKQEGDKKVFYGENLDTPNEFHTFSFDPETQIFTQG